MPAPRSSAVRRRAPAAPDIDCGEQEQPYDIDEMPVPGGRLEAEMMLWRKIAFVGPRQADVQENRANDDVGAMEPGRHEEGRAIDIALKAERRMGIFIG